MAQPWSLRYPLMDGQGNFGSVDGDSAAAMRYTEARMDRISSEMMKDLEKETVNFHPNFDDTLLEPEVLPTIIPNLFIRFTTSTPNSDNPAFVLSVHPSPNKFREL